MNRRMMSLFIVLLAVAWVPVNAWAYYYIFIRNVWNTPEQMEGMAHVSFRDGLFSFPPEQTRNNVALSFYNWLSFEGPPYLYLMYPTIPDAVRHIAAIPRALSGFMFEVSPDESVFSLNATINNLISVVPNQGDERQGIYRYLSLTITRLPAALIGGMPLRTNPPQWPSPAFPGRHIRRAIIYQNGQVLRVVERNAQDGAFYEAHGAHREEGYPFDPSPDLFPPRVSVVPNSDNLTSLACGSFMPARPTRSSAGDRRVPPLGACESETIMVEQFNRRHNRHSGIAAVAPFLLW